MKINFVEGAAITILLPLVFLLTGTLSLGYTVTAILLLFGAWSIVFGLLMAIAKEKMYYASWGAILVALSTIYVVPIQYTIALVIAVIILLVVLSVALRQGRQSTDTAVQG